MRYSLVQSAKRLVVIQALSPDIKIGLNCHNMPLICQISPFIEHVVDVKKSPKLVQGKIQRPYRLIVKVI
jgi:hypothetical protein